MGNNGRGTLPLAPVDLKVLDADLARREQDSGQLGRIEQLLNRAVAGSDRISRPAPVSLEEQPEGTAG